MPVSRRSADGSTRSTAANGSPRPEDAALARLRPYEFHGTALAPKGGRAIGDCPFCGREGKFSVEVLTGLWRCLVCGTGTDRGGGNALTFLRLTHAAAVRATTRAFLDEVARDRKLLSPETARAWGVARSQDNKWLVPGYGTDGELTQLYRREWFADRKKINGGAWVLQPTPGVWEPGKAHALHLPSGELGKNWTHLWVMEGPWDGMAMWEVAAGPKVRIVAVPGCNVWRDEWTELCRGKVVTLWYDSDHPIVTAGRTSRAGWDGMYRVARRLAGVASEVRVVRWGVDGYDPTKPSGWDVRDELIQVGNTLADRRAAEAWLSSRVEPAPAEWTGAAAVHVGNGRHSGSVESLPCSAWADCEAALVLALRWRQELSDAAAVLLAVCASTKQGGNQLFFDLVGSAGSAKTTLCDGLLVSGHCHHLEHLTGFHSGFKKPGDRGKDCSLIARINGKTLVTPEFDVMRTSPRYSELMGQVRRIFDGRSGATYKNDDTDTLYVALRTPWIRAGTPKMMLDGEQAHLGDRFMRLIIPDPPEYEKRHIMRSALRSERVAMLEQANAHAGSVVDPKTRHAHALMGGYVDWLRANVEQELAKVDVSEAAEDRCLDLAELCADLRARPSWEDKWSTKVAEPHDSKELPTRLARQNIRLAACLAVVLNKRSVDDEVLRIARKVSLDTASGHSQDIVRWLHARNPGDSQERSYQDTGGLPEDMIARWTNMTPERCCKYLQFLKKMGVLDYREVRRDTMSWVVSGRMRELYTRVTGV